MVKNNISNDVYRMDIKGLRAVAILAAAAWMSAIGIAVGVIAYSL
jgi:hypothetical protein